MQSIWANWPYNVLPYEYELFEKVIKNGIPTWLQRLDSQVICVYWLSDIVWSSFHHDSEATCLSEIVLKVS